MKKIYFFVCAAVAVLGYQSANAQCLGIKGPNLLGAKGTFSAPFITVNSSAAACTSAGANTYNPVGNIGNALGGCSNPGLSLPCSNYGYTSANAGLNPEAKYTIIKVIGDANGSNCIKGQWKGSDHTGDGGYFMAVNGAPNTTTSPVFYQIKTIPVCIGATYEFSAWVINLLPATSSSAHPGSEPNISFKVNGVTIGNSGAIPYTNTPTWVHVGGSFTATTSTVDLQVTNATAVASGNDLGLDDISINVCQSRIEVGGPTSNCEGNVVSATFKVTDPLETNTWYKWQMSTNGGASYTDLTAGAQAQYVDNSFTLTYDFGVVTSAMNGSKYRLAVSTSQAGLADPDCIYFNDYTLIVADCGPLPVKLATFNGRYSNNASFLDWQTSQELNSDRFEIFRSTDGEDFSLLATVRSAGFSNTVKNYAHQDNVPFAGNNVYYKLKQIDINGKATFSNVIRLTRGVKAGMDVYPNPFNTQFTIAFNASKAATATVRLRNTTGQLVYSQIVNVSKGNNAVLLNALPELGRGIYYISVTNDELNFNGKLQKQ